MDWNEMTCAQLLCAAYPGLGATKRVGSDSYGYYICSIIPEKKLIGLYSPDSHFKVSWEEGVMVTDPYEPGHEPDFWIQHFRGKWWEWDKRSQKRLKWKANIQFGYCYSYQCPSF